MTAVIREQRATEDREAQARDAVKAFRALQPTLSSYARALSGKKNVRVDMAAQDNGSTDGTRIFYRPPMALADRTPHERRLCDKRDETGHMRCPACRIRESVLTTIYHEIAHICYDSFQITSEVDKKRAVNFAIKEAKGAYADKIRARIDAAPSTYTASFMGLANLINEYLPFLLNCLEDARVNAALFKARPGVRRMFEVDSIEVFENGYECKNPDGSTYIQMWAQAPLNSQAMIGVFCKASGYGYHGYFHPDVEKALDDEALTELIKQINFVPDARAVFELSFHVLQRLRELGFLGTPQDPDEPDPEENDEGTDDSTADGTEGMASPDPTGQPDSDTEGSPLEDSDDSSGSSGDGDHSDEPVGDQGTDGDDEADRPDDGTEGSGADEASPEGVDDDSPEESSPDSEDDASADGSSEPEAEGSDGDSASDSGDEDSPSGDDQADGDSARDESGSEGAAGSVPDDSAASDDGDSEGSDVSGAREESDTGADLSGMDEGASPESGTDGSTPREPSGDSDPEDLEGVDDAEADSTGDGRPERADDGAVPTDHAGGEESDADSDGDDGASSESSDGTSPADLPSTEGDEGRDREPVSGPDGSDPLGEPDGAEEEALDTGADDGYGGTSVVDDPSRPEMGTPDDIDPIIAKFGDHEEKPKTAASTADDDAMNVAVIQGLYFTNPSKEVGGVNEYHYDRNPGKAWTRRRHGVKVGQDSDIVVPESVLQPAVIHTRRAFTDNQIAAQQANRRSGRVNRRVLGRRAWNDDDRLFSKKMLPGDRDYEVIIGMDISYSTVGINLALEKRAIFAQATLLHRVGIPFSIYAHTGDYSTLSKNAYLDLEVYHVKDRKELWNDKTIERLATIGPVSANLDGHALEFLRKRADESKATDKIIMYYSDGKMPAENHDEELEILTSEIRLCASKNITLMGVGIRTDSPARHGLDTVEVHSDEDMMKVVQHLGKRLK